MGVNQYGAGLNRVMIPVCYEFYRDGRGVKGRDSVLGIGTGIVAVVPRDRSSCRHQPFQDVVTLCNELKRLLAC